ncbi:uncharacterized protein [Misgurnus anguillicaudatus]|uniref:uncharacterized protein isoform X1 n=1 Tax=Misgurnus anguillicaudatus TaxID=75329 RepID=UPI003CCF54D9
MGNYNSSLISEVEEFKSIISTLESQRTLIEQHRLESTQTINHAIAEEQKGQEMNEVKQEPDLLALKFLFINTDTPDDITEPVQNGNPAPKPVDVSSLSPGSDMASSLPALLSAALSGSLPAKSRAAPQGPVTVEQMKVQLQKIQDELDLLKAQHKKEIRLLMNELDEEKKMRLSLQIDVERIKKHLSK